MLPCQNFAAHKHNLYTIHDFTRGGSNYSHRVYYIENKVNELIRALYSHARGDSLIVTPRDLRVDA